MEIKINGNTYTDSAPAGADKLAKGCYQRALLRGDETWSGSSLRGKAAQWGAQYKRSRDSLSSRLIATYGATFKRLRSGRLSGNGTITALYPVAALRGLGA